MEEIHFISATKIGTALFRSGCRRLREGNICEFRNAIERTVILADGALLTKVDLPYDFSMAGAGSIFTLAETEKIPIKKILAYTPTQQNESS